MEQAARGLDYLHREGIVHRDIKPQNIMLVGDVAKVCDYGLVVTTDADLRATSNAFTPLYASPEAVGEKPVTGQSDQYSLAITYVELRTGKSPYTSETAASVYAAKETGKYNLSRIQNKAVRNVLKRAFARSPNERFATCSAIYSRAGECRAEQLPLVWLIAAAAAVFVIWAARCSRFRSCGSVCFRPILPATGGIVVSPERQRGADARKTADEEPPQPPLPPPAGNAKGGGRGAGTAIGRQL